MANTLQALGTHVNAELRKGDRDVTRHVARVEQGNKGGALFCAVGRVDGRLDARAAFALLCRVGDGAAVGRVGLDREHLRMRRM